MKLLFFAKALGLMIASISLTLFRDIETSFYLFFIIPIVIGYALWFGFLDKLLGGEE